MILVPAPGELGVAAGADLQQAADAADDAETVVFAEVFGLGDEGH